MIGACARLRRSAKWTVRGWPIGSLCSIGLADGDDKRRVLRHCHRRLHDWNLDAEQLKAGDPARSRQRRCSRGPRTPPAGRHPRPPGSITGTACAQPPTGEPPHMTPFETSALRPRRPSETSCQGTAGTPRGRTVDLPVGGHQFSRWRSGDLPVSRQWRHPLPRVASVSRIESPVVMTTWAWCKSRSTVAVAMPLGMSSSKPEGCRLEVTAMERCS